eukprot:1024775_1
MASVYKAISKQCKWYQVTTKILKWRRNHPRFIHYRASRISRIPRTHDSQHHAIFRPHSQHHFCSNASASNRERFEMKILDLLEKEFEEKELTDRKLPQFILDELTADFEKPQLLRISKKELYSQLQGNAQSLMPFANLLAYWTVDADDELQNTLTQMQKTKDVNYVELEKKEDETTAPLTHTTNDDELLRIMDTQYKHNETELNTLYDTALQYYDLSNESQSMDINNRISSILLNLAAHCGHIEAQLQLGKQYLLGYGVEMDYKSAIYHFVRSGASGSVEARTYLGIMYMKGYGVKKNIHRAHVLLNECSRLMNPIAQRYLAELYEKGYSECNEEDDTDSFEIEQDHYIALRLAEKACTAGQIKLRMEGKNKLYDDAFIMEAATICGRMYCVHLNDFVSGIRYFEIAADLNDVDAQCNLGHIYWVGIPNKIEANIYKSVSYLLNAANKGHKRAHRELGMIYSYTADNREIENLKEGVLWLDLAGKEGYIDCYFRLGEIYASGNNKYNGIKQDFKVAKKYFEMARDESSLSKNRRDKLSENIWNLILKNPLQSVSLIDNYETTIGGTWRGQYLGDLDPSNYRQMASHS